MTGERLSYAVITPVRDEVDNLRRLARSLAEQLYQSSAWVIVDDGSTDGSFEVAQELSREHAQTTALSSGVERHPGEPLTIGRGTGRPVVAFCAGVASLSERPEIVVKVDADISFEPDYFDRLVHEFEIDPQLGIASGTCVELVAGVWKEVTVTRSHVRGASRAYRWQCFEQVSPLEQRIGWDGIDELKANVLGWATRSVSDLHFLHHRSMGERDGSWRAWALQGNTARFMGYRFSYLLLRSFYKAWHDPAAVALVWGYLGAVVRREHVHPDSSVRARLRSEQSLRRLPQRAREVLGRSA